MALRLERTCAMCDSSFVARRRDKKFCSEPCAQRMRDARRYGLSLEEFRRLSASGLCAACGRPAKGRMSIDHCHETGRVRGVIHQSCNVGLGQASDDPEILLRWVEYLRG